MDFVHFQLLDLLLFINYTEASQIKKQIKTVEREEVKVKSEITAKTVSYLYNRFSASSLQTHVTDLSRHLMPCIAATDKIAYYHK